MSGEWLTVNPRPATLVSSPEVPPPFAAPCRPICPRLSARQNQRTAAVRGGQRRLAARVTCLHPEPTSGGGGVSRVAPQAGQLGKTRLVPPLPRAPGSDAGTPELQLPGPFFLTWRREQAFQTHQWLFWGIRHTSSLGPEPCGLPAHPPLPLPPLRPSHPGLCRSAPCSRALAQPAPRPRQSSPRHSPSAFSSPRLSSAAAALPTPTLPSSARRPTPRSRPWGEFPGARRGLRGPQPHPRHGRLRTGPFP